MKHARSDYTDRIQDQLKPAEGGIPYDEPVFLLRAQDSLAADTVDYWADALESNGGDETLVQAVREHADLMRAWRRHKLPDTPLEFLQNDSGIVDLGPVDGPEPDSADDPLEGADRFRR